jgi:hypothetical protein
MWLNSPASQLEPPGIQPTTNRTVTRCSIGFSQFSLSFEPTHADNNPDAIAPESIPTTQLSILEPLGIQSIHQPSNRPTECVQRCQGNSLNRLKPFSLKKMILKDFRNARTVEPTCFWKSQKVSAAVLPVKSPTSSPPYPKP